MGQVHEAFVEHTRAEGASDRSFGLTVGAILIAIGSVRWFWFDASAAISAILVAVGLALAGAGAVAPRSLALLNRLWMQLGLLLARVFNPILMFVMFALLFAPLAIGMRLSGRDALRLRSDPRTRSYWIKREPPGPAPSGMARQF